MKILVGSKNNVKVDAVREMIADYPHLKDAEILGVETVSGVSNQPKSLEETVKGAINRAKSVFTDCDYSFGIESGLMAVPKTKQVIWMFVSSQSMMARNAIWDFLSPGKRRAK